MNYEIYWLKKLRGMCDILCTWKDDWDCGCGYGCGCSG